MCSCAAVFDENTAFSKRLATCETNIKGLKKASDGQRLLLCPQNTTTHQ